CLAIELWSLMKLFPFDVRYGLYGQWQEDTYRKTPQLLFIKQDVADKSRAILRFAFDIFLLKSERMLRYYYLSKTMRAHLFAI
ncbi:unnamed protein product, partial [Rotaria magnacalcarata]